MHNIGIALKQVIIGLFVGIGTIFGVHGNATTTQSTPTTKVSTTTLPIHSPSVSQSPSIITSPKVSPKTTPSPSITTKPKPTPTSTPVITPKVVKPSATPSPVIILPSLSPSPSPLPIQTIASTTSATSTSIVASSTPFTWDTINTSTRSALVNIICTTKSAGSLNPISGTGVIIDSRGVILTNAHIGQYLLLKDFREPGFVDCVIRTGNPAVAAYRAKLLYLSPLWIEDNAQNINAQNPTGTGENDFALLLIDSTTNPEKQLPATFPYLPMKQTQSDPTGENVLAAGYPAGFLGGITIQKELYSASAITKIRKALSYIGDSYDYLQTEGNIVAQHGSSGGAIVDSSGSLIGLIATVTEDAQTANRSMGAISLTHINKSLGRSGLSLPTLLGNNIQERAQQFDSLVAPTLTEKLEKILLK